MAKMIPAHISEETKSSAERKLFRLLKEMPGTEDWCVMHSVAIARHPTQSQGEGDFVIIAPELGTFVLEVKGGRISYQDGNWYSTDRDDIVHTIKDPQNEANEAMHGIRDYIASHNTSNLQYSIFGYGVVFPDVSVHGLFSIPDLDDLQIADIDDLRDIKQYITKLAGFWKSRQTGRWYVPKKPQTDSIVALLRPDHEFKVSIASQIRTVEKQMITLTDNQRDVFEGLLDNDRCLIKGCAGTGKTVLAVECARYWVSKGKRVGLFCYNRQLAAWLRENTSDLPELVCSSFLDYMENCVKENSAEDVNALRTNNQSEYYASILPELFETALCDSDFEGYDCIIMDEAQDIFESRYLETISFMLKNGIKNGNWYFFMDAERQNLYHASTTFEDAVRMLREFGVFYAKYTLHDNCRNSQAIIEKIDDLFGTHTHYRAAEERGTDVVIKSYNHGGDQLAYLEDNIAQLIGNGVSLNEITILSPFRFDNSVVSELKDYPVSLERTRRENMIFFSTVHAFKGLESPVIILTDFDSLDREQRKHLLYVGMTRARSVLYLLISCKAKKEIKNLNQSAGQ